MNPISKAAQAMGRVGGKKTGPSKARSSEKMRAAALVRWARHKSKRNEIKPKA